MTDTLTQLHDILSELMVLPLRYTHREERSIAFQHLTRLCREALQGAACSLTRVDLEQRKLIHVASDGFGKKLEQSLLDREFKLGRADEGSHLDYELFVKHAEQDLPYERADLMERGGGIADPAITRQFGWHSALCWPVKLHSRFIGFLNLFSAKTTPFTETEKELLQVFARQAEAMMDKFNIALRLHTSQELERELLQPGDQAFLHLIPKRACDILSMPACLIWKYAPEQKNFYVAAASSSISQHLRQKVLSYEEAKAFLTPMLWCSSDQPTPEFARPFLEELREQGWAEMMRKALYQGKDLLGLLDIYTLMPHRFHEIEKDVFSDIAQTTSLVIQREELQQKIFEWVNFRRVQEVTNQVLLEMPKSSSEDNILRQLLKFSIDLTQAEYGWVRLLNYQQGVSRVAVFSGIKQRLPDLPNGKGIVGRAMKLGAAQIVGDVAGDPDFVIGMSQTKSELAIPLLVDRVPVRKGGGGKPLLQSIPIGALNLETPKLNAFSQKDVDTLQPIVNQAALLLDKLSTDKKLKQVFEIEKNLLGKKNLFEVIHTVAKGIKDIFRFDFINISLAAPEENVIKTEYVLGITEAEEKEFKRMAAHPLNSEDNKLDIQADILRTKKTEVIDGYDPRFDEAIYKRFNHEGLIRVFLPIIAQSTKQAIGVVEAAYKKDFRDFIDERDIRLLQIVISFIAEAIDPTSRYLIARVRHELQASIVGIISNADFLRLWRHRLRDDVIDNKLQDILTDSDILLLNVEELEYLWGRSPQNLKIEETLLVRDILLKTVNQLKPLIKEKKADLAKVFPNYPPLWAQRIKLYVVKAKLNQVVYNLLLNAIKYSGRDLSQFRLEIEIEQDKDNIIVKFQDWGVGIEEKDKDKIFEPGFRSSYAYQYDVTGSGLGLTIARERMQEMGGDLQITNLAGPTEFQMIIPYKLTEAPK